MAVQHRGVNQQNGLNSQHNFNHHQRQSHRYLRQQDGFTPLPSNQMRDMRHVNRGMETDSNPDHYPTEDRSSDSGSRNGKDKDTSSATSRSHDKIKQNFKCPRFTGQTKDWKLWDKGFQRYLSIWDLDYVLNPDFFDEVPFPQTKKLMITN
jgi:hypothetical protein